MAVEIINGQETLYAAFTPRTDVYKATHDEPFGSENRTKSNWDRKKYMDRSFISFTFGGKAIEDWNLIAVVENDRLRRNGTANFDDLTSTYDVVDGQFYWGTRIANNELNLTLATDGITQNQLDEFIRWFAPGKTRELILAEHPNRAIMARVSNPPSISVLPFEEKTEVMIQKLKYFTSTTLYKGEINLSFVMDEPFWYSKVNLFGKADSNVSGGWYDVWTNALGEEQNIFTDEDALKIIKEDGIPVSSMITIPMILGNGLIIDQNFTITGSTDGKQVRSNPVKIGETAVAGVNNDNATTDNAVGFIGPRVWSDLNGTTIDQQHPLYLYYPGTAPVRPVIQFTLAPKIDSNNFISSPRNKYVNEGNQEGQYDVIRFYGTTSYQDFRITTPGPYTGYNQAVNIFKKVSSNTPLSEVRTLIRDGVNHKPAREWAIAVVDALSAASGETLTLGDYDSEARTSAIAKMSWFLRELDTGVLLSSAFTFDCKTGRAIGTLRYRRIDYTTSPPITTENFANWGEVVTVEEDVGDMVKSNYLVLEDRNFPTKDGRIVGYNDIDEQNRSHSYKISVTSYLELEKFNVFYKYMYY